MSAVIAEGSDGAAPVKRGAKGKRKLLIIVAAILIVVLLAGGGAVVYLRKKAAHDAAALEDADGAAETAHAPDKHELSPPTYLPLDPFVVNLADRDSDRYAQIGITLELQNPAFAEQVKAYMPAVRNAILMVITRKTSRELLEPMGKEQLADEIMREAVRPMGIEIAAPEPVTAAAESASGAASGSAPAAAASAVDKVALAGKALAAPAKKARHRGETTNPIQHVNFSSFIIQ